MCLSVCLSVQVTRIKSLEKNNISGTVWLRCLKFGLNSNGDDRKLVEPEGQGHQVKNCDLWSRVMLEIKGHMGQG